MAGAKDKIIKEFGMFKKCAIAGTKIIQSKAEIKPGKKTFGHVPRKNRLPRPEL